MDVTGLSVDSQLTRLHTQTAHHSFTVSHGNRSVMDVMGLSVDSQLTRLHTHTYSSSFIHSFTWQQVCAAAKIGINK